MARRRRSASAGTTTSPPADAQGARTVEWWPVLAVAAVALAASIAGLGNAFAYDDIPMIELNPRLQNLGNWREILTSPYWPPPWQQEHYRPFTSLFFTLQFVVGGGSPLIFRITSYLLYAACSAGVFLLAARLVPRPVALAVAILFAAHPVHVEVVAPAVGQSEMLVTLAALAMTILYLDWRRSGWLAPQQWVILALLYAAASLAKEHGFTLPALLVAVELCLLRREPLRDRVTRLGPGYAILGGVAAGLVALRFAVIGGEFSGNWVAEALDGLGFGERALTMLMVVPEWARLLVWPAHLRLDYAPQEFVASTALGLREIAGLGLVLVTLAGLAWGWRRAPTSSFGIVWMAVALAPVSNILMPTGSLLAERLLFFPSVGFLLAMGGAAGLLWQGPLARGTRRQLGAGFVGLFAVLGLLRSSERHRVWRNDAILSVRSVQDAPRSYRMQRAYADVLFQIDRPDLALEAYERSIELAPRGHDWRVRNDLATRLRERGERQAELEALQASLASEPDQPEIRGHLVAALLALGRYQEAISESDRAMIRGGNPEAFRGLRALADSAAAAGAPAGSIQVRLQTGARRR